MTDDEKAQNAEKIRIINERLKEGDDKFVELKKVIDSQSKDIHEMKNILTAWNNIKGFATTMRVIGAVVKWVGTVVAVIGGLWFLLVYKQWKF